MCNLFSGLLWEESYGRVRNYPNVFNNPSWNLFVEAIDLSSVGKATILQIKDSIPTFPNLKRLSLANNDLDDATMTGRY